MWSVAPESITHKFLIALSETFIPKEIWYLPETAKDQSPDFSPPDFSRDMILALSFSISSLRSFCFEHVQNFSVVLLSGSIYVVCHGFFNTILLYVHSSCSYLLSCAIAFGCHSFPFRWTECESSEFAVTMADPSRFWFSSITRLLSSAYIKEIVSSSKGTSSFSRIWTLTWSNSEFNPAKKIIFPVFINKISECSRIFWNFHLNN